ncbi:Bug family tripartite tricarboxylate transporter substrate binding protein [Rhodoplanes sp. Z2-YC6860]|uniref:Bug family tripartite tricarboxylate transporter substrate binding protein n=1 Tax=Rhodoplanes sp. Z2-YC6860 TaxID=674703 RepID=UPI00078DD6DA|nr:tripartite tricarboxylate transporter substrate binding protein [Rhodoplanes sp. Z2-YC6860]AMN39471.1 extra-cytoplasmic solute receptor protein [Rhodoplanes sp. Z2-YC6860]
MLRMVIVLVAAWATGFYAADAASAQTYPQRAVKFILPFGPASGTDITARLVADRLAQRWGKAAIIENRPGGDGLVAINAFVAANDDHTLLWVPVGTFAVHPYEKDKLPYNAERDLVPIAGVSSLFLAITVSNALNVSSLRELVELLRSNPDKYNWAAANGNADFLMSGFLKNNNLQVAKTPYRDILQAPNDLAENRIQLLSSSLAIVTPLMQAGKVKVLAVTGRTRSPSAPDVPTVREAGFPALEMESIGGIFGPRGMPLALREKIAADVRAAVAGDADIASKLGATGQAVDLRGPAEFAAGIKELDDQLAGIAKVLGLKAAAQ